MKKVLYLALATIVSGTLVAQEARRTLTNVDVLNMAKSGIDEQTIVLAIQQSPTKFDTSPEALIQLKKEGVSDRVLNAMLTASSDAMSSSATNEAASREGCKLLDKALNAFGTREKLASIHALRWKGTRVQTADTASSQVERITVYPDRVYIVSQVSTGLVNKIVVTPEFSYRSSGKMTSTVPTPTLENIRTGTQFDPAYVAQHLDNYSCLTEGSEQMGNVVTAKLKISREGREVHWNVDPTTGRLLRVRSINASSGEIVLDYSDWRQVDGFYAPFKRHIVEDGHLVDITISEYEVNPPIDAKLFESPRQQPAAAFTFRVLQSESVPYVVQTGGGISTNCQISGSTSTSISAYTSGDSTFGTATSTPNLRMNCNSSENTFRWSHVLNAMLVEASDGNAYIIACDAAWRWSKCSGLKPGDVFNARRTDKGIVVQFFNTKGQEKEATYSVLQAKSLR